ITLFHSGKKPLTGTVVSWTIRDIEGTTYTSGNFDPQTFNNGNGLSVGNISVPLNKVENPVQFNLEVRVDGTPFANDWNFWVYPKEAQKRESSVYYTTVLDQQAEAVLKNG